MRHAAAILIGLGATTASADPGIAALAPGPTDDVLTSVAISFTGAAFPGDGHHAWVRQPGTAISRTVGNAARGKSDAIAGADGAIFRLAPSPTGWTAIRLAQKGKAILANGPRAVAAIGRDVFELDRGVEPTRLPAAPAAITALGASARGLLARTDRGMLRLDGKAWRAIAVSVAHDAILVGDRWAISPHAILDVVSNATVKLPADLAFGAATEPADGSLAIAAIGPAGLELATVANGKLTHVPVALPAGVTPTVAGIVTDGHDRIAIALRDGRIAVRDRGTWSTTTIHDDPSPAHPAQSGSEPASAP